MVIGAYRTDPAILDRSRRLISEIFRFLDNVPRAFSSDAEKFDALQRLRQGFFSGLQGLEGSRGTNQGFSPVFDDIHTRPVLIFNEYLERNISNLSELPLEKPARENLQALHECF